MSLAFISKPRPLWGAAINIGARTLVNSSHHGSKSKGSSGQGLTPADPETHTGQTFEKDDYRLVRFMGKEKQVNPRFAIDLIASVPPTKTKARIVSCDGGGGPTGHPKVYINLDSPGNHSCGYCGLRFKKEDYHH